MERYAYRVMIRALYDSLQPVIANINDIGAERTLLMLDTVFPRQVIFQAYEAIYMRVGQSQKEWADQDVRERFPKKKEERNAPKLPNIGRVAPPLRQTGVQTSFGIGFFNPAWLERLKRVVTGFDVGQRVTSVSDTVKKEIRKSLSESVTQFVSPRKIIAKLRRDVGGIFSRQRAEVIARTEVTHIANIAAEQSAMETGLKLKKVWIFTRDDKTRDSHRNVSRTPIDSWDKFNVGGVKMDKPGDPSAPIKEVVRCRCIVAYLPADDFEDLEF